MDNIIINEFYRKILPSIKNGLVSIDGWNFNVEFQTLILDDKSDLNKRDYTNSNIEETLIISNVELFNKLLIKYVNIMYDIILNSKLKNIDYVYFNGNKKHIIDFILTNLWNNVTDVDLQNPINYMVNRINFLSDPIYDSESKRIYLRNIEFLENSDIEYSITLNNPVNETLYSFSSYIVRDKNINEIFELPKIFYGISNNCCYIYAVKGSRNKEKNDYYKKINRILYKVNKGVSSEYELNDITQVTPSALVALTLFFRILMENNITEINVIDYMPIRYKAKQMAIKRDIDKLKEKINDDSQIQIMNKISSIAQEKIQSNITDKFIRNFIRLSLQLGNLDIVSYPKDVDSMMHIKLNGNCIINDNILNQLYSYDANELKK